MDTYIQIFKTLKNVIFLSYSLMNDQRFKAITVLTAVIVIFLEQPNEYTGLTCENDFELITMS